MIPLLAACDQVELEQQAILLTPGRVEVAVVDCTEILEFFTIITTTTTIIITIMVALLLIVAGSELDP